LARTVQSVIGRINEDQLGFVQPHEHIYLDGFTTALTPDLVLDDPKIALHELQRFLDAGGNTIVEMTVHGLNPYPLGLRALAEQLPINIIAGTGLYWERYYPARVSSMSAKDLTELMVTELTKGIGGTNIPAGIIGEIGSGNRQVSEIEERVFRAAAAAQRETGVAIYTHAPFGRVGLDQVRILESAGADLNRVVIGHADTVHDIEYHQQLLATGVWIGYDTIGRADSGNDQDRAATVARMVQLGHAKRLLLSTDICRRSHLHYYGGHGYDHLLTSFLPRLANLGLDRNTINLLTRENPARLLASGG
jgi:phosphotriesterase-related protein